MSTGKDRRSSFSLLELLLVVVIIGIVAGLSTPLFRKAYVNRAVADCSETLAALMRFANSSAITQGLAYRVEFGPEAAGFWLTRQGDAENADSFSRIQGKFGRTVVIPEGVRLEGAPAFVRFFPDGSCDEAILYFSSQYGVSHTVMTEGSTAYVRLFDSKVQ